MRRIFSPCRDCGMRYNCPVTCYPFRQWQQLGWWDDLMTEAETEALEDEREEAFTIQERNPGLAGKYVL